MRNIRYAALPVLIVMLAASCAPVYRCGEPRPAKTPITWSKNLRNVVRERDIVCSELELREAENAGLKSELAEMTRMHSEVSNQYTSQLEANRELEGKYNTLIDNSLSQTEQLNQALMAKSGELDRKEKLLSEREETLRDMQKIIARQDSITKRLNNILHNALLGFNPDELSLEIKNGKVYVSMSDKLLFSSGSATVESKGREALKVLGDVLDKNTDIDILVEGHTDNVPIKTAVYKDNWDLSVARATSIVRILSADYNIAPTRLTASGRGEFFPKADNTTAEGRAGNRRTEIVLSPKLEEIMQLLTN
jgi:chemotaxis protein MotB